MDVQVVRHKRRRLHHQGRARRSGNSGARADGQTASRGRGEEGEGTAGQGLQEVRPEPGRSNNDRGIYRELLEGGTCYISATPLG